MHVVSAAFQVFGFLSFQQKPRCVDLLAMHSLCIIYCLVVVLEFKCKCERVRFAFMSGEAAMVSCSAGASELAHFPEQTQLRCGSQLCEHSHHPCAELHPEPHEEDDFATEVRYARTGLDRMFIGENFATDFKGSSAHSNDGSRTSATSRMAPR